LAFHPSAIWGGSIWYKAHPDRAIQILGHEGAAAVGVVSEQYKRQRENEELAQKMAQLEQEYELKTSLEEKKRLSRMQNGLSLMIRSRQFTSDEIEAYMKEVIANLAGAPKNFVEKTEQKKQMEAWEKEGKGVGVEWLDEWGNVKTRETDGTIKTQVPYDKTQAGQAEKIQRERERDLAKTRLDLEQLTVTDPMTGIESPRYSPIEIEAKLERVYPWYREQQVQRALEMDQAAREIQQMQQQAQEQPAPQDQAAVQDWLTEVQGLGVGVTEQERAALQNWPARAREQGIDVKEIDLDLPPQIGWAQAYLRHIKKKYGRLVDVPAGEKEAALKAYNTLLNAQKQLGE